MSITELFDTAQPRPGESRRTRRITCGACGLGATDCVNSFKGGSPEDMDRKMADALVRKFSNAGWRVSSKRRADHRCPDCIRKEEMKMEGSKVLKLSTVSQREMDRDDRRIIYEELEKNYDIKSGCYYGNWTDAKMAENLGIPRAWVMKIRDEMFGPEGSNVEIKKLVEEAKTFLAEYKRINSPLIAKADSIEKRLQDMIGRLG